jgi:hypothetical protein
MKMGKYLLSYYQEVGHYNVYFREYQLNYEFHYK